MTIMPITVGFNMPGYMPDSDPCQVEDIQQARDELKWQFDQEIDQLTETASHCADQSELDEIEAQVFTLEDAKKRADTAECGYSEQIGKWVYWIC